MHSVTTERFRKAYALLPERIKQRAKHAYSLWKENPQHSSLAFKQIHPHKPIYSVRIGLAYRSLGLKDNDTIIWFWIGSHEDYNTLITQI